MGELTIFLDKTTKTQFNDWLFVYGNNKRNRTYLFDKTRSYSLSFPVNKLDDHNQLSLDAIVTEPISLEKVNEDKDIYSYNDFEQKDVIKIQWLEIGERVKVIVSYVPVLRLLQPVLELLGAIAQDWQGTRRDILEYVQAQEKRYNIVIDTSYFPVDAAKPESTIADNERVAKPLASVVSLEVGTANLWRNEQGQEIFRGTANPGQTDKLLKSLIPFASPKTDIHFSIHEVTESTGFAVGAAQPASIDAGQVIEPPKPPEPKKQGGKISLWLDWYHAMLGNGYRCTLDDVARKSGYSLGYIKQRHMIYQAKPNQKT